MGNEGFLYAWKSTEVIRSSVLKSSLYVWSIAALAGLLHLAVAGRYDIFRNELYFIVCGRHPAFGYADQPPLVPLIAAATQLFGDNVWLLRLPGALAAIALVPLSAAFARLLGGGVASSVLAAMAAAIAPALIALTEILTTSTFETIAWTACAYFVARATIREDRKALLWAGLVAGLSMEAKYGIAIWLAALLTGLLLTPARRLLRWRSCWAGIALCCVIAAPSLIWQAVHGWPFIAVMLHHNATGSNFTGTPLRFEIGQIFAMNIALAPLWLTGVIAPFTTERLKAVRFLSIAFILATIINVTAGGKDYYLFPVYPTMFAVGAAAFTGIRALWLGAWLIPATALSALLAPIVLPILDPAQLAGYLAKTHLRPPPDEAAAVGAPLTQVFSDELGWRLLEKDVANVYRSLGSEERQRAAILATNYGEAAALDVYGKGDGLPPALSGQNQYFLWGTHGYDGSIIIHVNGNPDRWRRLCRSVDVVATFGAPYVMPYENERPIFICRGLRIPLPLLWDRLKRYQ
jgi:Dolichyl-phosphate-mannose-protein mannosyltransferase